MAKVRTGWLVLAACLLAVAVSVLCIRPAASAFAAEQAPALNMENVTAKPGETVSVDVAISGNPGIIGATVQVDFDGGLKLTNVTNGDAFKALVMMKSADLATGCKVHWDAERLAAEDVKDGVVATLTFAVPSDAKAGSAYAVSVSPVVANGVPDAYDSALERVDLQAASCIVTVEQPSALDKTAYVKMLYKSILNNANPSDYQVNYWVDYINTYGAQRAVRAMCASDTFKNAGYDAQTAVRKLYEGVLGNKAPTEYQETYWASRIDGGTSIDDVVDGFSQSAAFGSVCVAYGFGIDGASVSVTGDTSDYVKMLYKEILGNASPSDFQVNTWVNNINGGMRTADVVTQFTQSAAFKNAGYSNEHKVKVLYTGMLGNAQPSDFQVAYWANKLAAGTSLEDIVDGFSQSAAFGVVRGMYGLSM